jgi:hypothetical protein
MTSNRQNGFNFFVKILAADLVLGRVREFGLRVSDFAEAGACGTRPSEGLMTPKNSTKIVTLFVETHKLQFKESRVMPDGM